MNPSELRDLAAPLFRGTGGIDDLLDSPRSDQFAERVSTVAVRPLARSQLNQLITLCTGAPQMSEGFFDYYWSLPATHPWEIECVGDLHDRWFLDDQLHEVEHLLWGFRRFYIDSLLYVGDVDVAYRSWCGLTKEELAEFFDSKRIDTDEMIARGPALDLREIGADDRHLISEMACKILEPPDGLPDLASVLSSIYLESPEFNGRRIQFKALLNAATEPSPHAIHHQQLEIALDDELLELEVSDADDIRAKLEVLVERFAQARRSALENTYLYLSMVDDLDVYMATSMRTREHFRQVAALHRELFSSPELVELHVRAFDPTISAASGHVDKGLIENLMVRAAKCLVYTAGDRDSFGKDVEAAMALTQGKHVIFYCDHATRSRFFSDVHPLSRLLDYQGGVANGLMVVESASDAARIIGRVFRNKMRYALESEDRSSGVGYLLREEISGSIVRVQSSDPVLRAALARIYHASKER